MRFRGRILKGVFLERLNRFLGRVEVSGREALCYIPNPGRMVELLGSGVEVYLREEHGPGRKTGYDLLLVRRGVLVSIDSRAPNRLVEEAIQAGLLPEFQGYDIIRAEYTYRGSRVDFLLSQGERRMLLEVKSCTLVEDGRALFPDAPTLRGRRHLHTLISALEQGLEASILFVVQRPDAEGFSPNDETDPEFGAALREAASKGVRIYAYKCQVTLDGMWFLGQVPVILREGMSRDFCNHEG